ncbi:hypothetical protein DSO57_1032172 [Entomophthora muscae]|uniref:Uncharacterized protein n=1 Tax=Entomophthora muscae TaxID=34485 RepID=A0ACC2TCG8_9FUNG|nr:hypothetical protein DSO57_1032172 [Entomophthora muscae]
MHQYTGCGFCDGTPGPGGIKARAQFQAGPTPAHLYTSFEARQPISETLVVAPPI